MNKQIKKLIKQINKEESPQEISKLMQLLDHEVNTSYKKTNSNLRTRDAYEDSIYSQLHNKIQ